MTIDDVREINRCALGIELFPYGTSTFMKEVGE